MPFDQLLESPATLTIAPGELVQLIPASELTPVMSVIVTTAHGGVPVALPDSFSAEIASPDEYAVSVTKQTYLDGGGEILVDESSKTTTGFNIINRGRTHGEKALDQVWRV